MRQTNSLMKVYSLLNKPEKINISILLFLMLVAMGLETIGVGIVIPVITLLMQGDIVEKYPIIQPLYESLGSPDNNQLIMIVMVFLFIVYLVKNLFIAILTWRQMHFAFGIQARISNSLYRTYLHQTYTFHLQRNTAQLIRNVTGESHIFSQLLIQIMHLITECLVIVGVSILLILIEPVGILVIAAFGIFAGLFYFMIRGRIARWGKERQYHEGARIQQLQQGLGGAKDIKILGREEGFLSRFFEHTFRSAEVSRYNATLSQLPRLWLELLSVMGLALLVISMVMLERGSVEVVTTLGVFGAAAFRLMPSVNRIINSLQGIRFGIHVVDTLHEELDLEILQASETQEGAMFELKKMLFLDDITYTFPTGETPALNRVSISIKQGNMVGFIGPSGSGKSTLLDVVLGLLPPDSGKVIVDSNDIQKNLRAWQSQIGYVPQTIYLTDDTLRNNIAFGLFPEKIDDNAVENAIKSAQLDSFVASLPDGLDTIVGERGVRLSGGQRQRIGLARALYHEPSVLILDEATSALDSSTEQKIMKSVVDLHGKKTILVVAHRLTTVEKCDVIYKLEAGQVVDSGSYNKVINNSC